MQLYKQIPGETYKSDMIHKLQEDSKFDSGMDFEAGQRRTRDLD